MGEASVHFLKTWMDGVHRELISRTGERAVLLLRDTLPGISYQGRQSSSEEDGDDDWFRRLPCRLQVH